MLLPPFFSIGQAEITMKQNHHPYKINMMNKNGRDRLGFECQFLNWYLTFDGEWFLAHLDVRTPHDRDLHFTEQILATQMEVVMHIGIKYQHCPINNGQQRWIDEKIAE